ncbi:MAG: hypothetical protein LBS75_10360 [Synergistaceae bacterium]|nr:hypothetical protein [Synergistaceae bacterium]
MRGLLILTLILAAFFFLMPFILGFFIFLTLTTMIFMLLARLGLIPGRSPRTYARRFGGRRAWTDRSTRVGHNVRFENEEREWRERRDGWYESAQEGEVVILPETALKKDGDAGPKDE